MINTKSIVTATICNVILDNSKLTIKFDSFLSLLPASEKNSPTSSVFHDSFSNYFAQLKAIY